MLPRDFRPSGLQANSTFHLPSLSGLKRKKKEKKNVPARQDVLAHVKRPLCNLWKCHSGIGWESLVEAGFTASISDAGCHPLCLVIDNLVSPDELWAQPSYGGSSSDASDSLLYHCHVVKGLCVGRCWRLLIAPPANVSPPRCPRSLCNMAPNIGIHQNLQNFFTLCAGTAVLLKCCKILLYLAGFFSIQGVAFWIPLLRKYSDKEAFNLIRFHKWCVAPEHFLFKGLIQFCGCAFRCLSTSPSMASPAGI